MNEILFHRGMLFNYGNESSFTNLLKKKDTFNTIWGQDYFMMSGKALMNNTDEIIDVMMKCKIPDNVIYTD